MDPEEKLLRAFSILFWTSAFSLPLAIWKVIDIVSHLRWVE